VVGAPAAGAQAGDNAGQITSPPYAPGRPKRQPRRPRWPPSGVRVREAPRGVRRWRDRSAWVEGRAAGGPARRAADRPRREPRWSRADGSRRVRA